MANSPTPSQPITTEKPDPNQGTTQPAPTDQNQESQAITSKTCLACGHPWLPRQVGRPDRCPKCSSSTWDTGRKREPRAQQIANKAAREQGAKSAKKSKAAK